MLSDFKNLVKGQEKNILFLVFFVLIVLISFGLGYLMSPQSKQKPIVIKKSNSQNSAENNASDRKKEPQTKTPKATSKTFMASQESDKYHHPDCAWASKISPENLIRFSSEKEAREAGYSPCSYLKKHTQSN